jgi:hypothetical protein
MKKTNKPGEVHLLVNLLKRHYDISYFTSEKDIASLIMLEFDIEVEENLLTSYVENLILEQEEAILIYNLCV